MKLNSIAPGSGAEGSNPEKLSLLNIIYCSSYIHYVRQRKLKRPLSRLFLSGIYKIQKVKNKKTPANRVSLVMIERGIWAKAKERKWV